MDRDTQQELHQRSLRNVRALLDKEEAELARQKRAPRLLLYALVPAAILVAVIAIWGIPGRKVDAPDPKVLECQMRTWAERSGERERELRAQNPGITPSEVGARLQAENPAIEAAALRECRAQAGR
jgi:hypothetical protein